VSAVVSAVPAGRLSVSMILMQGSVEAQATIDVLQRDHPELVVADHGTFWKVTSETGHLEVDLDRVGEELGTTLAMSEWLVIMSSYVGRVQTTPTTFTVTSDITQIQRQA
jgi:hypothetical protein